MSWLSVACKIHAINSCSEGLKMKEKMRGVTSFMSCFLRKPQAVLAGVTFLTEGHSSKCNSTKIHLLSVLSVAKCMPFSMGNARLQLIHYHQRCGQLHIEDQNGHMGFGEKVSELSDKIPIKQPEVCGFDSVKKKLIICKNAFVGDMCWPVCYSWDKQNLKAWETKLLKKKNLYSKLPVR